MKNSETIGLVGITANEKGAKIALQGVRATMQLINGSLHVQIEQRYVNLETIPIEAVYSFPLPLEASVCGFRVLAGEREMVAVLEEREAAFERYDEAIAEGKTAYLLDSDTPNHFTCSVGNLKPGEDVTVIISYVQMLGINEGVYRLSLPTVIADVYTPIDVLSQMDPAALDRLYPPRSIDPLPYGLNLKARINLSGGIKTIDCPTHSIKTVWDGDTAEVSFSSESVAMDHNFIIKVTPKILPVNLAYYCPDPYAGGWIAFAQFMLKPASRSVLPQNITFMLDCSGSMQGESIKQAKAALQLLLASLQPEDRFNIVAFGSQPRLFSHKLLDYNDSTLSRARDWVNKCEANMGGTEVLPAINQALTSAKGFEQSIILLTDGDVGNTQQIVSVIQKAERRTSVYTIGMGYNTDEELLYTLANDTGGAMETVYPGENLSQVLSRHLTRIRSAKAESISLTWGGYVEQLSCDDYNFLPEESKWFMKHYDARPEGKVQLSIVFADNTELQMQSNQLQEEAAGFSALPQIYAKYMLQLKEKTPRSSLQRPRKDNSKAIELSKTYGVLCPETSFILVDPLTKQEMRSRIGLRRVPVAIAYSQHRLADVSNNFCNPSIFENRPASKPQLPSTVLIKYNCTQDSVTVAPSLSEQIVMLQKAHGYWDDHNPLQELKVDATEFHEFVEDIRSIYKLHGNQAHRIAMSLLYWYYLGLCDTTQTKKHLHIVGKAEQWLLSQGIDCAAMVPHLEHLLAHHSGETEC